MTRRLEDAFAPAPGDRIIAAIALAAMVAVLLIIVFCLGANYQHRKFTAACEAGIKFYVLGDPDVPYRCTRVIDYPTQEATP